MKVPTIENMKVVREFANVPDAQIQWLIDQGETLDIEEGGILFNIGEPVVNTYIILEGRLRICAVQAGKPKELRVLDAGQATGYLPYSRATVSPAFAEALKKSWIFKCSAAKLKAGFGNNYELIEAMVHIMVSRVREFTSIQQQNEKMFALGKLSAGLAHELNNPAAAISRAAALLQEQIKQLPGLFKDVSNLHINAEKIDKIDMLIMNKINAEPAKLNMLQRASLEDEIADWLYDNNIKTIDTEGLTERGFAVDDLKMIKGCASPQELPVVLEWISNYLVTNKMADDIRTSSERISELIGAVKNFTFMDKDADRQMVDIHSGIKNTLIMLNHKLRKLNINVVENFDDSIPKIKALPGELNQVWTNIIDNAIDAMESNGKGNLEITSAHDARFVKVFIKDNGPGIPENIKEKIFDPFFTTKEMGKGSGLGLDVVNRIMIQHNGDVKVKSEPGATEFEICFPAN
ncbi:MAG TPA: ATP-binding protein [Parafilimonas sp.]|nr:ATP-binding protein [Parafilimonas sp.]